MKCLQENYPLSHHASLSAGPLGPFVFGLALDNSCSFWDGDGACLWYEVSQLRGSIFTIMMVLKIVSLIGLIIGTVLYKAPPEEVMEDIVIVNGDVNNMVDVNELKHSSAQDNPAFLQESEIAQTMAF